MLPRTALVDSRSESRCLVSSTADVGTTEAFHTEILCSDMLIQRASQTLKKDENWVPEGGPVSGKTARSAEHGRVACAVNEEGVVNR